MRGRKQLRRAALVALLGAAAFAGVANAAPHPAPIAVSLTVDSPSPQAGDGVLVTARVKHLPRGDLIVIRVTDGDRSDTVATCRTATCDGDWTEGDAATARFQAFVRTKPKAGRIAGRSSVVALTWSAPPPPPPPPPAVLDGHYCGLSNEGKSVCFDVTGDAASGQMVQNVRMESNVTCADVVLDHWTLATYAVAIDPSTLSFNFEYSGSLTVNGASNVIASYMLAGTFDTAGNVSGTIHILHISWDQNGRHYDCAGDPRTWTARLGA